MHISTRRADVPRGPRETCVETYTCRFGSGRVTLAGDLPLLVELPAPTQHPRSGESYPSRWVILLEEYFAGHPVSFGLGVERYAEVAGLSPFELDVYRALSAVPAGTVVSYRELAAAAGHPSAYRAVGSAMARNRLPVILPCHRVIRNDGSLGQYGADPAWKERLLTLEGVQCGGGRIA